MANSFGRLTLRFPDGRIDSFDLTRATVRLGRGVEGNDIDLGDDPRISRQHAQLSCTPGRISVLSLSPSGLSVDGVRLDEGATAELSDGAELVIEPVLITVAIAPPGPGVALTPTSAADEARRTRAEPPTPTRPEPEPAAVAPAPLAPAAAPPPAPTPSTTTAARGPHLALRLNSDAVSVAPGARSSLLATVEKRHGEVDAVRIVLEGIPTDWYSVEPSQHNLYPYNDAAPDSAQPESRGVFTVTLQPPRHHSSASGSYACTVVARSEARPGSPATAAVTVTVDPFGQLDARLSPRRLRGGRGTFQLAVANHGNQSLPLRLSAVDDEGRLGLTLAREQLELAPGQSEQVAVTARAPWRWPFGRPVDHSLLVTATPDRPGMAPITDSGQLILQRLPAWLQILPLLLLLGLILFYLLFLLPDLRPAGRATMATVALREDVYAQVVPRDPIALAFERDGVVQKIYASPSPTAEVKLGDLIVELRYYEQLLALRQAEDGLERALADLEAARRQQERDVRLAELALQQAQTEAARVAPGGPDDPARQQEAALAAAQRDLAAAQRAAASARDEASGAKSDAEDALVQAAEDLKAAQERYSKAYWENDWVEKYGTDPNAAAQRTQTTNPDETVVIEESRPVKLNAVQKQAFRDALAAAERDMAAAERAVATARRALDRALADEIAGNVAAEDGVAAAQEQIATLAPVAGQPNLALEAAQINVEIAEVKVDSVRDSGLEPFIKAVEAAQQSVDEARRALENRSIRAPADGLVLAVTAPVSTSVQAAAPVVLFARDSQLELAATLTPAQLAALERHPEVAVHFGAAPDEPGSARLMGLPTPPGDRPDALPAARFELTDAGLASLLQPGAAVRLAVTLDERPNAATVAPPFLHADGEDRYLLVRAPRCGWSPWGAGLLLRLCERKLYVLPGIAEPERVEIRTVFDPIYTPHTLVGEDAPLLIGR